MQSFKRWSRAALFVVAVCVIAGPGKAKPVDLTEVIFQEVEKRLIREYFASRNSGTADSRDSHEQYRKGKGKAGKGAKRGPKSGKGYHKKRHGKKEKHKRGKKGQPPGLGKKRGLPPGLAKRKRLPPGLAKRALPADLDHNLPAAPEGTERVIIDNNVVLVQKATGLVLDILLDAVKQAR